MPRLRVSQDERKKTEKQIPPMTSDRPLSIDFAEKPVPETIVPTMPRLPFCLKSQSVKTAQMARI
jgi:hypothetical protein